MSKHQKTSLHSLRSVDSEFASSGPRLGVSAGQHSPDPFQPLYQHRSGCPRPICSVCKPFGDDLPISCRCDHPDHGSGLLLCKGHGIVHQESCKTKHHVLTQLFPTESLKSLLQPHQIIDHNALALGEEIGRGGFGIARKATLNGAAVCAKVRTPAQSLCLVSSFFCR